MADTVAARPPQPVNNRALAGFVLYFAAILPLALWGLYTLISRNSVPLPKSMLIVGLPATSVRADTIAFLEANQQTRLVLDQGELLLAVMLAGGIGSYIHGVNSFVTYVGNRSFLNSWIPWYVLRPFMGVAMAVIFYAVVRGGVLVMSGGANAVDPYAMMAVAALAGMFSKQASDKLAEVFDTLFRSRADAERADKLPRELKLATLAPDKVTAGSGETVITATGTGFAPDAVVRFDKKDRAATVRSATELTFTLTAAELAAAGEHTVAVHNPAGAGTTSNELKLPVTAAVQGVERIVAADGRGGTQVVSEVGGSGAAVDAGASSTASGRAASEADEEADTPVAAADANGAMG